MKKRVFSAILIAVILVGLCGCQKKADSSSYCLHNARWNMTMEEVKNAEGPDKIVNGPSENVLNWLQTTELDEFGNRNLTVAYIFTDNKLTNITVQLFVADGEKLDDAVNSTKTAMNKVYGTGTDKDGITTWKMSDTTIQLQKLNGSDTSFIAQYSPVAAGTSHAAQ